MGSRGLANAPRVDGGLVGTVALAVASTVTGSGALAAFGVLYPAIMRDRGWTATEVTTAFSVGMLVYGPLAVASGMLLDRFGVRRVMFAGCALLGLGLAYLTQATELWQLYAAWITGSGLGTAGVGYVSAFKLLSIRAGARYELMLGFALAGGGLGPLVLAPALQAIIDVAGWQAAAGAMAVGLVAVLLPLIAWFAPGAGETPRAAPPSPGPASPASASTGSARALLAQPALWLLCAADLAIGYLTLLPTHLVAHLLQVGFSSSFAASAAGLLGLAWAIGSVAAGWLVRRWGSTRTQVLATTALVAGLLALMASTPAVLLLPVLFLVVGGPGRGALLVPVMSVAQQRFAGAAFGRVAGILEVAFAMGSFLGSWVVAFIRDTSGSYVPGLATGLLGALVVLASTAAAARTPARAPARRVATAAARPARPGAGV